MRAFMSVNTQWRVVAASGLSGFWLRWIGLDYAAARAGIEAAGVAMTPALWEGVRVMEKAALPVLNKDR